MNFSARVKNDPETEAATPILLVESEAPKSVVNDKELLAFLKYAVPKEVEEHFLTLHIIEGNDKPYTDVWLTEEQEEGEEKETTLRTSAFYGDQVYAKGEEEVNFLRTRIIEVMQNADNWHRKPRGVWKFSREFSLEVFEETPFKPELKPITKDEIESIVENGVNAMYKTIQDKIGVETGDNASQYHSGTKIEEELVAFFVEYVRFEKKNN